ncbi:MAG TPA: hypothetical protein VKB05_19180 [Pyrinomonadaceae bacterium]|nr:hypothetical protein [Pyrinomonadaceae bacterium]
MSTDPLLGEMKIEHDKWSRSTVFYGAANVAIRLFLILASALVAADKSILASHPVLGQVIPLLAVAVTVVTAIDSWLKPRDKWRGFMEDRDDLADLLIRGQKTSADLSTEDKLREDFTRLRRRHRNKNVY